jgi:PAS domain S-box-containing protein
MDLFKIENEKDTMEPLDILNLPPDGIIILDRGKKILGMSRWAERITGFKEEEVRGRHCQEILHNDRCNGRCPISRVIDEGKEYSHIFVRAKDSNGSSLPIIISAIPFKDSDGLIKGALIQVRDIREMEKLTRAIGYQLDSFILEKAKLESIVNSIGEGVFTIDKEWRITSFNRSAEMITGFSREEVLGKECRSVFRSLLCQDRCPMEHALSCGKSVYDMELTITTKENKLLPILANSAPLFDKNGEVVGGVETFRDISQLEWMKQEIERRYDRSNIIGVSHSMKELFQKIENLSKTDSTVLIQGESGTGKELIARAIHYKSNRKDYPFVGVNCSALSEGLLESELFGHVKGAFTGAIRDKVGRFELAHKGTLFLDEIGEIGPSIQVKLLRVLEEREFQRVGGTKDIKVDIRLIAATNKNLLEEVKKGRFRSDLYYRLNVITLNVPPLRERREDIPPLVEHFIEKFNNQMGKGIRGISRDALQCLMDYSWPGNVRELENAIEHAFVHSKGVTILLKDLPYHVKGEIPDTSEIERYPRHMAMDAFERQLIIKNLEEAKWKKSLAAKKLGMSPVTLWRKMKKYGMI